MADLRKIPKSILIQIAQLVFEDKRLKVFDIQQYKHIVYIERDNKTIEIYANLAPVFWERKGQDIRCCPIWNPREIQKLLDPYAND